MPLSAAAAGRFAKPLAAALALALAVPGWATRRKTYFDSVDFAASKMYSSPGAPVNFLRSSGFSHRCCTTLRQMSPRARFANTDGPGKSTVTTGKPRACSLTDFQYSCDAAFTMTFASLRNSLAMMSPQKAYKLDPRAVFNDEPISSRYGLMASKGFNTPYSPDKMRIFFCATWRSLSLNVLPLKPWNAGPSIARQAALQAFRYHAWYL
mmetsp:Transcript_42948/g.124192  ORF Transcript_42948/g.124192 Transcript_42948/m.124192 type:complete len:209 (+) Transcript_42948:88-714(+)